MEESFVEANNTFSLAMYHQLRTQPGNVFFSPFSIRTALAMALAGARGVTATQMADVLRFSNSAPTLPVSLRAIIQRLNTAGRAPYELAVANSLWAQDGVQLQAEYLDLVAAQHVGEVKLVDFVGGGDEARTTVNQWVKKKTQGRIPELIPCDGLGADTRLVLANAVYFRGRWVLPFRREFTQDRAFHRPRGGSVPAPLMDQRGWVGYFEAADFQAVELDYEGGDLSMLVILPKQTKGLPDLEKRLSARLIDDSVRGLTSRPVALTLPRFKLTWGTVDLREHLSTLGMPNPFDRFQADFSGINGYRPPHEEALLLSGIYHKAFVEVNEDGTEATAATTGDPRLSSSGNTPVFCADHPFLFAIRGRSSGALLFLGRIEDPTRDS